MADVVVSYLGRALSVKPAVYGELFHDHCTVSKKVGMNSGNDPSDTQEYALFWYETDPEDASEVFCTMSGFGDYIVKELNKQGLRVEERRLVHSGLCDPDLSAAKEVTFRPRQAEVFSKILAHDSGVIVCPMAWGKSFLCRLLSMTYPSSKIIITAPSIDICSGMYNDLLPYLGSELGLIGGGKDRAARVTIVVSQSLHTAPKDASLELCDECHSLSTENYLKYLNMFYRAKIFGFSATYGMRGDKADGFNEAVFGPVLAEITYQESVKLGNVTQLKVLCVTCNDGPDITRDIQKYRTASLRRAIWRNSARNDKIVEGIKIAIKEFGDGDPQILVMTESTEHAFLLGQLLPGYVVVHGPLESARKAKLQKQKVILPDQEICTPKMRESYRKAFESGEIRRAISTKVWRQGVDFTELNILARADGAASAIDAGQVPGRLSRRSKLGAKSDGLVVDVCDSFSHILNAFWRSRAKNYTARGWPIEYR